MRNSPSLFTAARAALGRRFLRDERRIDRAYLARPPALPRSNGAGHTTIDVIMPVRDPDPHHLREAIASIFAQTQVTWRLIIADDASTRAGVPEYLREIREDQRVEIIYLPTPHGVSAATNAALAHATADVVAFVDHDDLLAPFALAIIAREFDEHPDCAVVFSDEDRVLDTGAFASPYFKPGLNQDLLIQQNFLCHLTAYRRSLLEELNFLRTAFDGAQDHDLALRALAKIGIDGFRHVPQILYHWRAHVFSLSVQRAEFCKAAARRAIADFLGNSGKVIEDPDLPNWPAIKFALPEKTLHIAVICDGDLPFDPTQPKYLISHIRNQSQLRQLQNPDLILLLSPSLRIRNLSFLDELAAQALRPGVGAAGAKLYKKSGFLAHAGFVLDPQTIVQSPSPFSDHADPGYRGAFALMRTVSAVSGDCLITRAAIFHEAGGLNPAMGDYADIDYCLQLRALGYRVVYTPAATLTYAKYLSNRRKGQPAMLAAHDITLRQDPFQNPNLRLVRGALCPAWEERVLQP